MKRLGVFGALRDLVFRQKNDNVIYVALNGRIEYQWADQRRQEQGRVSTFAMFIPLIRFNIVMAEMGCRSRDCHSPSRRSNCRSTGSRYQLAGSPEEWSGNIGRAGTKRFSFSVMAPKSSNHLFQVVLQLSDGGEVRSPLVRLSYFRPRLAQSQEELLVGSRNRSTNRKMSRSRANGDDVQLRGSPVVAVSRKFGIGTSRAKKVP